MLRETTSLREYQRTLSARLVNPETSLPATRLGFLAGGRRWLVNLDDAAEVIPVPQITPVALTRPWFLGVAGIRGALCSVIDFGAFCEGRSTAHSEQARLLIFAERHRAGCGLLIEGAPGLYRDDQLRPGEGRPSRWSAAVFSDGTPQPWQHLDVLSLLADADFLQVAT